MSNIHRKEFLKKAGAIFFAALVFPRYLFSNAPNENSIPGFAALADGKDDLPVDDFGIIDLHSHPSLKIYLWNRKMRRKHFPKPGGNFFAMQVDAHELNSGRVKGLIATHYLIEMGIEKNVHILKKLFPLFRRIVPGLTAKFEREDYSNFTQINIMIDELESQINGMVLENKKKMVIARDYLEFKEAIARGDIPVAHAIEGAHGLGREEPISIKRNAIYRSQKSLFPRNDAEVEKKFIRNLEALKARGVCMITLAHFFPNDLVKHPVEGISYDEKKKLGIAWKYTHPGDDEPLTPLGTKVVEKMLQIGVIVDLTHSNPQVRADVFKINKDGNYKRPIIFSHAGAQKIFNDTRPCNGVKLPYSPDFGYYNASDSEINEIVKCDGVIGVIPENFWLVGCDKHIKECNCKDYRNGIDYIISTIDYIKSLTGTYDNIAIGSDFDGLADAPNDLYVYSQLKDLTDKLIQHGLSKADVRKITHENAMRVLQKGWS